MTAVRRFLRGFTDEAVVEERVTDAMREAHPAELRRARVAAARGNARWVELEAVDLVERDRYLVSAETDEYFTRSRGVVFESGSATVIADQAPLRFYIDAELELVFLERVLVPHPPLVRVR